MIIHGPTANAEELAACLPRDRYRLVPISDEKRIFELLFDEQRTAADVLPDLVLIQDEELDHDYRPLIRNIRERGGPEGFVPVVVLTNRDKESAWAKELSGEVDAIWPAKKIDEAICQRIERLVTTHREFARVVAENRSLAELLAFREEMVGLIVHDLKNPLTVIQTNLLFAMGQRTSGIDAESLEALDDAHEGCARLLAIITNLLDIIRLESNKLRLQQGEINIQSYCEEIRNAYHQATAQKDITFEIAQDPGMEGWFDPDLLRRVIDNLLMNAIRYAPEGGQIQLAFQECEGKVVGAVRNNGPTIPDDHCERLFLKFESSGQRMSEPRPNLGLGLYFCRLAVEAHGGRIALEKSREWPVSFVFSLPKEKDREFD